LKVSTESLAFVNIGFIVEGDTREISSPTMRARVDALIRERAIKSLRDLTRQDAVLVTASGNERHLVCINPSIVTKQDSLMW
jgi:hypothetical protein